VRTTRYADDGTGVADRDGEALAVAGFVLDGVVEPHAQRSPKRRMVTAR
jgi:hypothetical protein